MCVSTVMKNHSVQRDSLDVIKSKVSCHKAFSISTCIFHRCSSLCKFIVTHFYTYFYKNSLLFSTLCYSFTTDTDTDTDTDTEISLF